MQAKSLHEVRVATSGCNKCRAQSSLLRMLAITYFIGTTTSEPVLAWTNISVMFC